MVLLTLLRILLVLTVLSYAVVLLTKRPSDKIVFIPYFFSFAYTFTMLFYHTLVGGIAAITAIILQKYAKYSMNHEEFYFRFEIPILYLTLFVFVLSSIYMIIETCFGRLF